MIISLLGSFLSGGFCPVPNFLCIAKFFFWIVTVYECLSMFMYKLCEYVDIIDAKFTDYLNVEYDEN
jgi:hypothetical protein